MVLAALLSDKEDHIMSNLPDGTNPYGRLLQLMCDASPEYNGIVKGEYLGDGRFQVGGHTFDRDEVLLIQNEIIIDDFTFKIPGTEEQKHTVKRSVTHYYYASNNDRNNERKEEFEFDVEVPPLQKGDTVIAYQFGDEEYVILGKVV